MVKAGGQRTSMVHDIACITAVEQLRKLVEDVMSVQSVDDMDSLSKELTDVLTALKMISAGLCKAPKTLANHIDNRETSKARAAAKQQKAKQQEQAKELKQHSKETARAIEKQKTVVGNIFKG